MVRGPVIFPRRGTQEFVRSRASFAGVIIQMDAWAHFVFGALALGPASSTHAPANSTHETKQGWAYFALDNDFFLNTDRYYTSGILVGLAWDFDAVSVRATLGQEIYTPRYINIADPQPGDRPWAGHMYLGVDVLTHAKDWPSGVGFRAGVIGPAALAQPFQTLVHYALAAKQPRGWDHQLDDRVAAGLWVAQGWQRRVDLGSHLAIRVALGIGGELGTVRNRLTLSTALHVGFNLERGITFDVREPAVTTAFEPRGDGFRLYLTLTSTYRVTERDVFLDGGGQALALRPCAITASGRPGIAFVWGKVRLAFQYSLRTRDFATQSAPGHYGSGDIQVGF